VLVVGGGLSGAAAAWSLRRQQCDEQPPLAIHTWDGARGCGGRLATARLSAGGTAEARANMGAQRLHHHATQDAPAPEAARLLCEAGVVEPEEPAAAGSAQPASFVATGSSNEVCKLLLREASAELRSGQPWAAVSFRRRFVYMYFTSDSP
jgi:predicted NAD/FAD-dependent oxidoreductase